MQIVTSKFECRIPFFLHKQRFFDQKMKLSDKLVTDAFVLLRKRKIVFLQGVTKFLKKVGTKRQQISFDKELLERKKDA